MTTPYLPGERLFKENTALSWVWPLLPKTPQKNSARGMGPGPSASNRKGGRAVALELARADWLSLTVASIPEKSEATLAIALWRSEATSPFATRSKERRAAPMITARVASPISLAVTQFSARTLDAENTRRARMVTDPSLFSK